ncbi:hypothetical protein RvY_00253 [Ramazzottius varieornatus]|uniref:Uncharacterized protein n=1 Tax=Ramazzottius varieornatus TaxID=947166 RepID=A0A1D1UM25_RAMVA|nr:hypothetical protein RvY_00253 [Ramazzottius varieornatus]
MQSFLVLPVLITVAFCMSENSDIVLDESRPDVFYCPTKPYTDDSKKILTALPIAKLCEYGAGKKRPQGSPQDCFNDADEMPLACDEKSRFMKRLKIRKDAENLINSKDF